MTLRLTASLSALLISGTALPVALAAQDVPPERILPADALTVISGAEELCQDPALIGSPSGAAAAAWTGILDGRSRVFLAEAADGAWQPRIAADEALSGGEATEPALAWSDGGEPLLTWISVEGGEHALWFRPAGGGDPELVHRSAVRIETPSLSTGSTPWVAWSEGGAGRFAVTVARREGGAETPWTRSVLSAGLNAYDILPHTAAGTPERLWWYSLTDESFALRAARFDGAEWQPQTVPAPLSGLPGERLPLLYDVPRYDVPGALWLEPLDVGGDALRVLDPRVADAALTPSLPAEAGTQSDPDAEGASADPVWVWREDAPASEPEIVLLTGDALTRVQGIPHPAQPRIAHTGEGLTLVLISDRIDGGDGRVYAAEVQ